MRAEVGTVIHPESFDAMRERLAREGKIERDGAGYQLTPAGNDHALRLIDELARAEDPGFSGTAIRWNYNPHR